MRERDCFLASLFGFSLEDQIRWILPLQPESSFGFSTVPLPSLFCSQATGLQAHSTSLDERHRPGAEPETGSFRWSEGWLGGGGFEI